MDWAYHQQYRRVTLAWANEYSKWKYLLSIYIEMSIEAAARVQMLWELIILYIHLRKYSSLLNINPIAVGQMGVHKYFDILTVLAGCLSLSVAALMNTKLVSKSRREVNMKIFYKYNCRNIPTYVNNNITEFPMGRVVAIIRHSRYPPTSTHN